MKIPANTTNGVQSAWQCLFILLGLIICVSTTTSSGKKPAPQVQSRSVNIWSDGTRLSGDIFFPVGDHKSRPLPAIIMCHGWGGLRSHLNEYYAPADC